MSISRKVQHAPLPANDDESEGLPRSPMDGFSTFTDAADIRYDTMGDIDDDMAAIGKNVSILRLLISYMTLLIDSRSEGGTIGLPFIR